MQFKPARILADGLFNLIQKFSTSFLKLALPSCCFLLFLDGAISMKLRQSRIHWAA